MVAAGSVSEYGDQGGEGNDRPRNEQPAHGRSGGPAQLVAMRFLVTPWTVGSVTWRTLGVLVDELRVAELRHQVIIVVRRIRCHGDQYALVSARIIRIIPPATHPRLIHQRRALLWCFAALASNAITRAAASAASVCVRGMSR